jgi:putative aldouronate transport system substrate-binding protein
VDVIKANGNNAYLEPYEIPTKDGKPGIFPIPFDNAGYNVINAKSKNIAAILKSVSYVSWVGANDGIAQGLMTIEELGRYIRDDGTGIHDLLPFEIYDLYNQGSIVAEWAHEIGLNNFEVRGPFLVSETSQYENAKSWHDSKNIEGYGRWIQEYAPRSSAWINNTIIKEGRYVADRLTGPMPEEAASYGTSLDDLLTEGFTQIIVGERPISYFDTLVAEWKASGGNVITAAVNRVYGRK